MASVRFLQALAEGNPRHSGETSELIKSNPAIHVGLGACDKGTGTPENTSTNPLAN